MAKGGSGEVKETSAQKALADVASSTWDLYYNDLRQYEDHFIDNVDQMNSDEEYDKIAGTAALGSQVAFGEARAGLSDALAAGGVDPTSGKYQEAMKELETEQAMSQTDTTNRAQSNQQDRYVAGLQDVMAIGQGQKAEALSGYSGLASASLNKATSDAQASLNNKQATMGLVGAVGGAGVAYQMNSPVAGSKKISPTASVLQGKGY